MNDELRSQFSNLKQAHTVRPEFSASLETMLREAPAANPAKEQFHVQFKTVVDRAFEMLVPARLAPAVQGLTTMLLIFGVATSGWIGAVSASYNAVPGDALYNVKLATEKVQIVAVEATGDKSKKAKLHTEFAERRAVEVKKVIETNKEPEQARTAIALLAQSVNDANEAVKEAQADVKEPEAAVDSTEALLADTERIAASLLEVLKTLPPNVSELIDEIVVIHGDLTDSRLSTLQEIVSHQLDGRSNLSEEEARAVVVNALKQISDSNEEVASLVQKIEDQVEATDMEEIVIVSTTEAVVASTTASTTLEMVSTTEFVSTTTDMASSTDDVAPLTETIETAEVVTIEELDTVTDAVQEEIDQATALVEDGDLFEAIEKAKSANNKQTEAHKVVQKAAAAAGLSPNGDAVEEPTTETIDEPKEEEKTVEEPTTPATKTDTVEDVSTSTTTTTTNTPTPSGTEALPTSTPDVVAITTPSTSTPVEAAEPQ